MDPNEARQWGETWREQHTPRCWVPPEGSNEMADVHDIRDALPTGRSLSAADLAAQVNLELERQRGWYLRADGYYGPAPVAAATEHRGRPGLPHDDR